MADIEVTVSENVSSAFRRLEALGQDLTPAMAEIAQMMSSETRFNFLGQHDPLGVPWKPRRPGQGEHPILRKTGDLFGSIKEDWGKTYAAAGPEASAGSAIYAAVHQFGARITPKQGKALRTPFGPRAAVNVPARPFLGWNPRMESRTLEILADHIIRAAKPDAGVAQ